MDSFRDSTWAHVEALRLEINALKAAPTVQEAAQDFAQLLARACPTVVLSRVFAVLPLSALRAPDQQTAERVANGDPRLKPRTRVLSLLGTSGVERDWANRQLSRGHRAIPLIDREFVQGAPMIAKLLADLQADLAGLDSGHPIATRRMLGGNNSTFYVPDAQTALDAEGRLVIGASDFVKRYQVRTVFGMGGAYFDGTLVVAILFTREEVDRLIVDRFPSLIGNFKIATAVQQAAGAYFQPVSSPQ